MTLWWRRDCNAIPQLRDQLIHCTLLIVSCYLFPPSHFTGEGQTWNDFLMLTVLVIECGLESTSPDLSPELLPLPSHSLINTCIKHLLDADSVWVAGISKVNYDPDPALKAFTLLCVFDFPEGLSSIQKKTQCQGNLSTLDGLDYHIRSRTAPFLVSKYLFHKWYILWSSNFLMGCLNQTWQ